MNLAVKFFVVCSVMVTVSSAGILDTLLSWGLAETEARSTTPPPPSKCLCQASGCLCCVDLNLTAAIDLGGPVCLNIKQKEENVTLNMSFGENAMHNATIRIAEAANKRTCMNLLSDLAQLCATFTTVKEAASGYDGCLAVEPELLSTTQAVYQIGCFNFNQDNIRQLDTTAAEALMSTEVPETSEAPEVEEGGSGDDEDYNLNPDELIAAVSASAEQGIALFSQWLGLNLNPSLNQTKPPIEEAAGSSRGARKLQGDVQREAMKSEERFKQILSAQDNIQKESPRLGQAPDVETTYVYTEPQPPHPGSLASVVEPEAVKQPEVPLGGLAVVPRESRRGGRAYNIHQHVNEI